MHLIPLVLYGCAAGTYMAHFAGRDRSIGRLATALLGAAVLAHTFIIGMQTVQVGHAPLVGTTAAVSAFVWLLGLAYLYVELTTLKQTLVRRKNRKLRRLRGASYAGYLARTS